jgi:hypothetical protein
MQEAVEGLHPADGVFDRDADGGLPPVPGQSHEATS